jgi:hypothetical protein
MNEPALDDQAVIARLRSALDEVTGERSGLLAADAPRHASNNPGRWLAVAAAVVLVIGGVTAVVINRNHQGSTPAADTTPITPTEPTLIRTVVPWYVLASQDLAPGEVFGLENQLPADELTMAWALGGNPADGLLVLRSGPSSPALGPADTSLATYQMIGEQAVAVASYGLTPQEQADLAAQIQPGSGLPWVLPVEGWAFLGMGAQTDGATQLQRYSNGTDAVDISVGPLIDQFFTLAAADSVEPVTVAGRAGWKATNADVIYLLWPAGDSGQWATMTIEQTLADRVDGLIAAVAEIDDNTPTVDTVPAPLPVSELAIAGGSLSMFDGTASTDPAVGLPAPTVDGFDYEGNAIRIDPAEGPHLVMFQAHWCPHCAANLPNVEEWLADGTIPSWLPVTLVSTAESPGASNYPADRWLQELGWTGRVLRDTDEGDGAAGAAAVAYGASGWPYYVVIGVDGTVLARASGELTKAQIESLMRGLPNGPPQAVGRLQIPTIGLDWLVVDNSLGLTSSARLGPVFVGGALPTELPIGENVDAYSMIYGSRTTYGAPFLDLDQLVAGDTITWTDETGTATFEVVSTTTCPAADGCPGIAGALVLTTSDPPYTDQGTLYVYALRTA